ncbi:MAG: cell division protein FtsA [Pyrinomonadaceae bacterium]|nr:cell division protein FtsA [Pyrinomonadaceae bacterium]
MSSEIQAVGLDVGTSKVRCVIGESSDDGKLNIIGVGEAESKGLRRGIVTSAEAVAESIRKAVAEAERVAGIEIDAATVNLSGEHFKGENKNGVVAVAGPDKEITDEDADRAIESACAMPLPPGWDIVNRVPQEFIIDGQDGITEPVGMTGSRLEALVHVVISPSAARQNLVKAVKRAGLDVEQTLLEPLAAAESTLSDDDREYGCALVNMGSEITSLMIFGRGAVQHTAVFPFGSMHFTKDIAVGLRVSIPEANKIKHAFGCVAQFLLSGDERDEMIEIQPVGRNETRGLSKEILCDIMQPRAVELLQHIAREANSAKAQISGGVIMTGGGSLVRGMCELAEQVFDAPTRLGFLEPEYFGGMAERIQGPEWATASGLALTSLRTQIRESGTGGKSPAKKVVEFFGNIRNKFR